MIKGSDKISNVIIKYPYVKEKLFERNERFKNLDNPVVFKVVGKFARISDVAKVSGEDLDGLLNFLNSLVDAREILKV